MTHLKEKYTLILIFITITLGTFVVTLDTGIVNIALPSISQGLNTDLSTLQWVVSLFFLTISGTLMVFGRLGDILGSRKIFALGFGVFALGSLLCGFATNITMLLSFRILQGVGAAIFLANSMGAITKIFPINHRSTAIGTIGTVIALGTIAGPGIGGFILSYLDWRYIFFVNVPLGFIGLLASLLFLPDKMEQNKIGGRFDFAGTILLFAGITLFLYALSTGIKAGWPAIQLLFFLAASCIILILFYLDQQRKEDPLINMAIFKSRVFLLGNIARLLSFTAMFFVLVLLPFYFESVKGYPPAKTGMMMTAYPLSLALLSPVTGWLAKKMRVVYLTAGGMLILALSLYLIGKLNPASSPFLIYVDYFLIGVGSSIFHSPNNTCVMVHAHKDFLGIAGGVAEITKSLGKVISIGLFVNLFYSRQQTLLDSFMFSPQEAFLSSWELVYNLAAIIALIGAATAFFANKDIDSCR